MMNYIKISLFLIALIPLFFFGSIVNAKESISLEFNEGKYKWSHENELKNLPLSFREDYTSIYPVKGYFSPVLIHTNSTTSFYQNTNEIIFGTNNRVQMNCENGKACNIEGTIFARDIQFKETNEKLLENIEVYYGLVSPKVYLTNDDYRCDVTYSSDNIAHFSCSVPSVSYTGHRSNYVRVILKDKIYQDVVSSEEYAEKSFLIGIGSNLNYECNELVTPTFKVEKIDNSSLKVSITNSNSYTTDTNFQYTLWNENDDYILSCFGTTYEHTFEHLSNGVYKIYVEAIKNENKSLHYSKFFEISDSILPVAISKIDDIEKTITIDLSDSYSPQNVEIVKYYFSLDGDNWYESSNPIYNFLDKEYAQYNVYYKVKDANNNMSMTYKKVFEHKSPEQKRQEKFDSVLDNIFQFLSNPFKSIWDLLVSIVIPNTHDLEENINKLTNTMNKKLGFLGESVSFVVDEMQYVLIDPGVFERFCLPSTSMPEEMGGLQIIGQGDGCLTNDIIEHFSSITSVIKVITSLLLIGWFTNYCYQELLKILGGVSIDYK